MNGINKMEVVIDQLTHGKVLLCNSIQNSVQMPLITQMNLLHGLEKDFQKLMVSIKKRLILLSMS